MKHINSSLPFKQKALDKLKHKIETKRKGTAKLVYKQLKKNKKTKKDLKADVLQLMSRSSFVFFS